MVWDDENIVFSGRQSRTSSSCRFGGLAMRWRGWRRTAHSDEVSGLDCDGTGRVRQGGGGDLGLKANAMLVIKQEV